MDKDLLEVEVREVSHANSDQKERPALIGLGKLPKLVFHHVVCERLCVCVCL